MITDTVALTFCHTMPFSSSSSSSNVKSADSPNDPRWNALAQGMDRYHQHLRAEFERVYKVSRVGMWAACMLIIYRVPDMTMCQLPILSCPIIRPV